LIYIY